MKISFIDQFDAIPDGDFSTYHYREDLRAHQGYVDIRAIVANHQEQWLDDLAKSHGHLGEAMLQGGPWWWLTPFSRLDARPWGLESTIKPLFFARALLAWGHANPLKKQLTITGCPSLVAYYLRDFDFSIVIEGVDENREILNQVLGYFRQGLVFLVKLLEQLFYLFFISCCRSKKHLPARCLVLFERFSPQMLPKEAFNYYYDRLFDSPALKQPDVLSLGCLDQASFAFKTSSGLGNGCNGSFHLLQALTLKDVFFAIGQNLSLGLFIFKMALLKSVCDVGGKSSKKFWQHFLLDGFAKSIVLKELIVYRVISRCMQNKMYEIIVYPYEEKGYERAVLLACQGHDVKTIGYVPHPQHHLALAMKDTLLPRAPRPDGYGVCGQLYIDYFEQWAGKTKGITHVWGSVKSSQQDYHQQAMPQELKALLLLSHPHELDVFVSWLRAEPAIAQGISYQIRSYKSVPSEAFQKRLEDMFKEFSFVTKAEEDFDASLRVCDFVLFNATSAGLLAINRGKVALHLSLDDFFAINPCFDDLSFMLHCQTSFDFAKQLVQLRGMPQEQVRILWQGQRDFVTKIFFPIGTNTIEKDLLCTNN